MAEDAPRPSGLGEAFGALWEAQRRAQPSLGSPEVRSEVWPGGKELARQEGQAPAMPRCVMGLEVGCRGHLYSPRATEGVKERW